VHWVVILGITDNKNLIRPDDVLKRRVDMPDKAYVILYEYDDECENAYLYFPIKRDGLRYAGMPQFFGGTKNHFESDFDCISREIQQESDDRLTVNREGLKKIHSNIVGGDNYNFYMSNNFNGKHFLGDLTNLEMSTITSYIVDLFCMDRGDIENLMDTLGIVSTRDFVESETYTAFNKAIQRIPAQFKL